MVNRHLSPKGIRRLPGGRRTAEGNRPCAST